jgi:plasmid maintenance system antidote protein VapI
MSTTAALAPIHPGEILAEEYLIPLGVTQQKTRRSEVAGEP